MPAQPGSTPPPPVPPKTDSAKPFDGTQGKPPAGFVPAEPPPVNPEDVPPDAASIHTGFLQQPWVQDVLPFVTSFAFHAAVVIVIAVLYGMATTLTKPVSEEQIIIPEAAMATDTPGGVENPGIGGDPTRPAAQDKYEENTDPAGWAKEPGQNPVAEPRGGGEGDNSNNVINGQSGAFGRGAGIGSGDGDGTGGGSGTGKGRLAPFGAPGGGIPGPRGKVFGNGGNARTIAFCCDSSGSMIDKFSSLKAELGTAISGLRPVQQFSIVFFANDSFNAFEKGILVNATPENKRRANKWLDDLTTSGTSNPIPGLEVAFRAHPDLMYILTDGDFPNNNEVLTTVAKANASKKTRINSVAFVSKADDETSESFKKFLVALAEGNGGKFKRVSLDQLDQ